MTVVIPALNEERGLPLVLAALPPVGKVLVVDNGSTDQTAERARQAGAEVVAEPKRGYGAACWRALVEIRAAVARGEAAPEVVGFLDADFSDHPDRLHALVEPIVRNEADLVIGSRVLGEREPGSMPRHSYWGTRLGCWMLRRRFGIPCTDLGPFRAIRWECLDRLEMRDRGFGWTVEMQIKAALAGLRVVEIPVPYRRRVGDSKISGTLLGSIGASAKILYTLARYGLAGGSRHHDASGQDLPNPLD